MTVTRAEVAIGICILACLPVFIAIGLILIGKGQALYRPEGKRTRDYCTKGNRTDDE